MGDKGDNTNDIWTHRRLEAVPASDINSGRTTLSMPRPQGKQDTRNKDADPYWCYGSKQFKTKEEVVPVQALSRYAVVDGTIEEDRKKSVPPESASTCSTESHYHDGGNDRATRRGTFSLPADVKFDPSTLEPIPSSTVTPEKKNCTPESSYGNEGSADSHENTLPIADAIEGDDIQGIGRVTDFIDGRGGHKYGLDIDLPSAISATILKAAGRNSLKERENILYHQSVSLQLRQAAKARFEKEKAQVLAKIPNEIKSRFRQVAFAKWGRMILPVIELGPYDLPPGKLRDEWFALFEQSIHSGRPMQHLIYWYGHDSSDENTFSFYNRIISYQNGIDRGYDKIPHAIQKKIDNKTILSKAAQLLIKGLDQLVKDAALERDARIWPPEWEQDLASKSLDRLGTTMDTTSSYADMLTDSEKGELHEPCCTIIFPDSDSEEDVSQPSDLVSAIRNNTKGACACKKTKCLKLYCVCFAAGEDCGSTCSCVGCKNKSLSHSYKNTAANIPQRVDNTAVTNQYNDAAHNVLALCKKELWEEVAKAVIVDPSVAMATVKMANNTTTTIMHQVIASKGDVNSRAALVTTILSACPGAVLIKNGHGSLPLHLAVKGNCSIDSTTIISLMQAYPTALVTRNGRSMKTPLHVALSDRISSSLIKRMIAAGPEATKIRDKRGWLPIHTACSRHRSSEIVRMLIGVYPASLHEKTGTGESLMDLAKCTEKTTRPNTLLINTLFSLYENERKVSARAAAGYSPPPQENKRYATASLVAKTFPCAVPVCQKQSPPPYGATTGSTVLTGISLASTLVQEQQNDPRHLALASTQQTNLPRTLPAESKRKAGESNLQSAGATSPPKKKKKTAPLVVLEENNSPPSTSAVVSKADFPFQLMQVLSDRAYAFAVGWRLHGKAFAVVDVELFEEILREEMEIDYSEFLVHLEAFGFQSIGSSSTPNMWRHEMICRDSPHLARMICTKGN